MAQPSIHHHFNPTINVPYYLTRKRLLNGIRANTGLMKGRLLDFGCGSKPYKSLFDQVDTYTGLDFENPGHDHSGEQIDVYYDGHTIPFENNSFDSVFSTEVFEHVFNLDEILPEINRVMKPGALILITCPFAICEHEQPNDFARYSSFALRHIMNKHGFEVVVQDKLGNSVEVVLQLWIMYIHMNIVPFIRKIPVVREIFRSFTYTVLNLMALGFGRILPQGKELYLNNLIVCKKIR